MDFKLTPVLYVLLNSIKRFIFLQGGTNSGKTYNSLIYICSDSIDNNSFVDDIGISHDKSWIIFVSDIAYSEKNGAYKDLLGIMDKHELWEHVSRGKDGWERKLNRIRFKSGGSIQFATTADLNVARKGTYVNVYFPEVNSVSEQFFEDVKIRCKNRIIVDYNSDSRFYIHDLIDLDRCNKWDKERGCIEPKPSSEWSIDYHIFNYRHNIAIASNLDINGNFIFKSWLISKQMRQGIEDYCVKCEQTGLEKWCQKCRVLARGLTGSLVGLVYPDVTWVTESQFEDAWLYGDRHAYAADYGYVNSGDPSVITANVIYDGKLWSKIVMYEFELKREGWRAIMNDLDVGGDTFLFDSSQAKETYDYLSMFFYGMQHARRYPKGVVTGIKKVREYDLMLVDNEYYRHEQGNYKLAKVKGSFSRKVNPMPGNDHVFDTLRYYVEYAKGDDNDYVPAPVNDPILI